MTSRINIWIPWKDLFGYEMKQVKKRFPFLLDKEYIKMEWIKTKRGWDGRVYETKT